MFLVYIVFVFPVYIALALILLVLPLLMFQLRFQSNPHDIAVHLFHLRLPVYKLNFESKEGPLPLLSTLVPRLPLLIVHSPNFLIFLSTSYRYQFPLKPSMALVSKMAISPIILLPSKSKAALVPKTSVSMSLILLVMKSCLVPRG